MDRKKISEIDIDSPNHYTFLCYIYRMRGINHASF